MIWPFKRKTKNRAVQKRGRRGYAAATSDRLTNDWQSTSLTADGELRYSLQVLRGRSRDLAMNNDYMRRYLKMCVSNIMGPKGITLQIKARGPDGVLDKFANRTIEAAWKEWGRRGTCTVCGRYSWTDILHLAAEITPRDGEFILEKVSGKPAGNKFGFALNLIEADHLDETMDGLLPNGNEAHLGVEIDELQKPIAYYFLKDHPGAHIWTSMGQYRIKVPADRIIHSFLSERIGQSRGIPWAHTCMKILKMIEAYTEAELIAARAAASKMGFLSTPGGDEYTGDDKDDDGNVIDEFEPGLISQLPQGYEFTPFDPDSPNTNLPQFLKAMLQRVASGLNVAYSSLASDLEKVNYSSIRSGVLEERNTWRKLQRFFIGGLCTEVFEPWLKMALNHAALGPLPVRKFDKFNAPIWQPRGWDWVDPLKDEKANAQAVTNLTKTRAEILAERGLDLEDTFEQLAYEKELAISTGLVQSDTTGGQANEG